MAAGRVPPFLVPVGVALLAASAARADTVRASAGPVSATVEYSELEAGYGNVRVAVARSGRTVLSARLGGDWRLVNVAPLLRLVDLDGDAEREVLVESSVGASGCCTLLRIYRSDRATGGYRGATALLFGYRLLDPDADGLLEIVTADRRFRCEVAACPAVAPPVQVLRFRDGRLVDVTRSFPALVQRDARGWLAEARRARNAEWLKATLAAYLADQYRLGRSEEGWRTVRSLYRGPDRAQYLSRLERLLRRWGYAR